VGPTEIGFIRETFKLSQRDLAKALSVAPYTVMRWEAGKNEPTGLQEEVLRALYNTAAKTRAERNDAAAAAVGGMVALGIGALIFYLLTRDETPARSSARRATAGARRRHR
jgi:transcriptional regulator with XRE-family HTH domain